jgi:hypothetical protein
MINSCFINIMMNWFENYFGFKEKDYLSTKQKLANILTREQVGLFEIESNGILHEKLDMIMGDFNEERRKKHGVVLLENIVKDCKELHHEPNVTIQVASQFNCLEMVNPSVTPEDGITIYQNDKTQGPMCAMCCPAGLAYRNYLYNEGQTKTKQIDMTNAFFEYLKKFDPKINHTMRNGYLFIESNQMLERINNVLRDPDHRRNARLLIMSGNHMDMEVDKMMNKKLTRVNHVYCSGLPISYNSLDPNLWDGLAEIFLEAMYENTLMIACLNNYMNGKNNPCYLTKIGGGVFGMKQFQISRAIQRACNVVAKKGHNLNVKIVHYKKIDPLYESISHTYPIKIADQMIDSVWDSLFK